jgi:hypothetical protein
MFDGGLCSFRTSVCLLWLDIRWAPEDGDLTSLLVVTQSLSIFLRKRTDPK